MEKLTQTLKVLKIMRIISFLTFRFCFVMLFLFVYEKILGEFFTIFFKVVIYISNVIFIFTHIKGIKQN